MRGTTTHVLVLHSVNSAAKRPLAKRIKESPLNYKTRFSAGPRPASPSTLSHLFLCHQSKWKSYRPLAQSPAGWIEALIATTLTASRLRWDIFGWLLRKLTSSTLVYQALHCIKIPSSRQPQCLEVLHRQILLTPLLHLPRKLFILRSTRSPTSGLLPHPPRPQHRRSRQATATWWLLPHSLVQQAQSDLQQPSPFSTRMR